MGFWASVGAGPVRVGGQIKGTGVGTVTAGAGFSVMLLFGSVAFIGTVAICVAFYLAWWLCTYPFAQVIEFLPGLAMAMRIGIGLGLILLALALLGVFGLFVVFIIRASGWIGVLVLVMATFMAIGAARR